MIKLLLLVIVSYSMFFKAVLKYLVVFFKLVLVLVTKNKYSILKYIFGYG